MIKFLKICLLGLFLSTTNKLANDYLKFLTFFEPKLLQRLSTPVFLTILSALLLKGCENQFGTLAKIERDCTQELKTLVINKNFIVPEAFAAKQRSLIKKLEASKRKQKLIKILRLLAKCAKPALLLIIMSFLTNHLSFKDLKAVSETRDHSTAQILTQSSNALNEQTQAMEKRLQSIERALEQITELLAQQREKP